MPTDSQSLHKKIVAIMKNVPRGQVATYGQIAKLAGAPMHTRQVVWALHSSSKKYKIPWHRIVNSKGQIALQNAAHHLKQRAMLIKEGVEVNERSLVDLEEYQWAPKAIQLKKALTKTALSRLSD